MAATTFDAPIDAILEACGQRGPWRRLPATGIANVVYATRHVVIRVATDHPDAVPDALTESVAAPTAHAAGIPTPRLLYFDASGELIERPFSVWERVHGKTLGLLPVRERSGPGVWRAIGRELARLHVRVERCDDPHGYLDPHVRATDLEGEVDDLVVRGRIDADIAATIASWIAWLRPRIETPSQRRFLHGDLHAMNVMSERDGTLKAIIDWGDAGWGDPVMDLQQIPIENVPDALAGYEEAASGLLGDAPEARIAWDHLAIALGDRDDDPGWPIPVSTWTDVLRWVQDA